MKPIGSTDDFGRCRSEGFCDLCGDRVWWCADPPGPYLVLPFNDDGGKHWKTCKLGLEIEDKTERIYRMVSEKALKEYRKERDFEHAMFSLPRDPDGEDARDTGVPGHHGARLQADPVAEVPPMSESEQPLLPPRESSERRQTR